MLMKCLSNLNKNDQYVILLTIHIYKCKLDKYKVYHSLIYKYRQANINNVGCCVGTHGCIGLSTVLLLLLYATCLINRSV